MLTEVTEFSKRLAHLLIQHFFKSHKETIKITKQTMFYGHYTDIIYAVTLYSYNTVILRI